jgi:IS5 family transposase
MTRRRQKQLAFTQVLLFGLAVPAPEALMDPELRRVDELLDDELLVDQVFRRMQKRRPQSARRGRSSTAAEVVLRMLALKHIRDWTYEQLEWEVTGNFVYRRFCRIDGGEVPDAKTMVRYGQLLDGPELQALLARSVAIAVDRGVTKGKKLRIDTTVVEAPIPYPTDSGMCADGVRVLYRGLARLAAAGIRLPFHLRNASRSVMRRLREIGQALRRRGEKAKRALRKPYRKLLRIVGRFVRQSSRATKSARRQLKRLDEVSQRCVLQILEGFATTLPRVRQVIRQTRARVLRGVTDYAGKILSIFEPYARILRRGKLHRPTEFGVLANVQETEGGIVSAIEITPTSHDSMLLVPSVERHIKIFGHAPRLVATDRGFHSGRGERRIRELGIEQPVIPFAGYKSPKRTAHERQRWFRRGRAWRQGAEARISRLKRRFGMGRSRARGEAGMRRTVIWAAIANNLTAIAART